MAGARRPTFAAGAGPAELEIPDAPRSHLRRGPTGETVAVGTTVLRLAPLPLFRRRPDGRLERAVRVASDGGGTAELTLRVNGEALDSATLVPPGRCLLFAPDDARRVALEASCHGVQATRAVPFEPQRRWSVFLVHHSHLDVGYTDLQPVVLRHHRDYLDAVLELARATDTWPDDARFRWNVEANLPLQHWLAARTPNRVAELIDRIRDGRVEVGALPFTSNLEACSIDELAWQLEFAMKLRRTHGVAVETALQTDVPGHGHGLPGLLAAAGVRYLDVAHNWAARAAPYLTGGLDLPRLFRWRGGGGDVLVWHTDSPRGVAYLEGNLLGLADVEDDPVSLLPEYLAGLAASGFPYGGEIEALGLVGVELPCRPLALDVLHLRVQGAIADNAAPSIGPAEVVRSWNEQWVHPRLRLATNREFFAAVEERSPDIPELEGDWTSWWADGIGSSARATAAGRRAQSRLRLAQTVHVVADLIGSSPMGDWPEHADAAYGELALFDEHTWGAAFPERDAEAGRSAGAEQWHLKAAAAHAAEAAADDLLDSGLRRLGGPSSTRIGVLNPSGWERTDLVRLFVPATVAVPGTPFTVDAGDGREVPCSVSPVAGPGARNRPQGTVVSFLARDVPPIGFRAYELRPASEPTASGEVDVLENDAFRVAVDTERACVTSIRDKQLDRELVEPTSAFGFGEYVYDRYLDPLRPTRRAEQPAPFALLPDRASRVLALRETPSHGVVVRRLANAVEQRVTVRALADGVEWLETTFGLVHGVERVEIEHRLSKRGTREKEGVYFAFPFAADDPELAYDLTGGTLAAAGPFVPGSARHANVVRHWVSLAERDTSFAWCTREAPLVQLGDVYAPYPPYLGTLPKHERGLVVSWAMNNVWDTNFPVEQGGEAVFAYAVGAAVGTDASVLARRTAAGLTQPFLGVVGWAGGDRGSIVQLADDDVELVGLAAAEPGHDFVVRLLSRAREPRRIRVGDTTVEVAPGAYIAAPVDFAP